MYSYISKTRTFRKHIESLEFTCDYDIAIYNKTSHRYYHMLPVWGPGHLATQCKFKEAICHQCKKKGHLRKVCRRGKQQGSGPKKTPRLQQVCRVEEEEDEDLPMLNFVSQRDCVLPPLKVRIQVDDCRITMEVDTGASLSLMAETTFRRLWPSRNLNPTEVRLCTYSKQTIPVLGSVEVDVAYQGQTTQLPLVVVKGGGPTLMGRNWLNKIVLNWNEIHYTPSVGLQDLLGKYQDVFQGKLGTLNDFKARICVDPDATPRFCKARTMPYSVRGLIEKELDRLVQDGQLEAVDFSDWATPIVAVVKEDKQSVRICGDFRATVNPFSKLDRYPIPRIEDLFATLKKGKLFTKLDLSQAYQQLVLEEESKKYVVLNTHKGLFRCTRLPYGISSAPGIFQRVMDNLLQGLPGVVGYIDDILISGEPESAHLEVLEEVLKRLSKSGFRAKKQKCKFMVTSVDYLGYRIDAAGLHPLPDKVQAVEEAPTPTCLTELKSYLGLLTYYAKFLPNLATHLAPLYKLLGKDVPWQWGKSQEKAFHNSKKLLTSSNLLIHFDTSLPLTLACDASAYGIGAVLAHRLSDGSEKPVGYVSRTLTKAEKNYSQLEKEGLSLVFGVKKFYSYLFGHSFELVTDHKPLLSLLSGQKPTSPQASARIRRWSLYLSSFEYTLKFRNTTAHGNADALSRLPLQVEPASVDTPPELVLLTDYMDNSPVTADQVRSWTHRDPY